jgi:prepilin-type N-terminal cleavage/methylation domain-containing protein
MVGSVFTSRRRVGFTLIELLAVVVIISLLAALTLTAYRALAKDSRISLASNTIRVALQSARAASIELNKRTMLVFRPVLTEPGTQQIEAMVVVESGEVFEDTNVRIPMDFYSSLSESCLVMRFKPLDGYGPFLLPKGVMLASPIFFMLTTNYEFSGFGEPDPAAREEWISLSYLPQGQSGDSHASGMVIGVIFDQGGTLRTSFTDSGSQLAFVDFNNDGSLQCGSDCFTMLPFDSNGICRDGVPEPGVDYECLFGFDAEQEDEDKLNLFYGMQEAEDEPYVLIAPYIALYDYDEANELYAGDTQWRAPAVRLGDLDQFVRKNGHVLYFNRFTGAVSK